MSHHRVYVSGSDRLRDRVADLDGVAVVEDPGVADCATTDHPSVPDVPLPTVAVLDDVDALSRPVAGFCRPTAGDHALRDQIRLAARHNPAAARSKAERLHDVSTRMVACNDPDDVYALAAEAAERILDLDLCWLGEAREEVFEQRAVTSRMTPGENYTEARRIDEGVAGRTYQTGESVLTRDVGQIADAKPADDAYRSVLSVPIGDVGVFQAAAYEPDAFDEYDRDLVELLMSHVGETVTRLRTEARLRERNKAFKRLHATAIDLVACDTETDLCETLLEAAEGTLELEVCAVVIENDEGLLEVVAASDSPLAPSVGVTFSPEEGVLGETFQTGETILVDRVEADDRAEPADERYRSALSVPLGQVGVIQAISAKPDTYDDRDRELVELLASQAAAALARVRVERELVAERDRLAEFGSVLSHDLRNPLNVARGYLEIAAEAAGESGQRDAASEPGETNHFDRIDDALDRMERIVDDVLLLARDPVVEETSTVDLAEAAAGAAEAVGLADSNLEIRAGTIEADRDRLLRMLENLFTNAREHAGPAPTVRVVPLPDGGFAVADDGPGIPVEERECIFDSGYTTNRAGTGLGLSIVRSIAEAHGWRVTVTESEAGGARIEVRTD